MWMECLVGRGGNGIFVERNIVMEHDLLDGLTKWVKAEKGITKIELTELVNYIPEYKLWLRRN